MTTETFVTENDDLLIEEKSETAPEKQKRNSKSELINRIVELSDKNNVELEYSDTKLKRMNKTQLQQIMADQMEKVM